MPQAAVVEFRVYNAAGTTFSILPDYESGNFQDTFSDVGFGSVRYPVLGKNYALLGDQVEIGVVVNNVEILRFIAEDTNGQDATDASLAREFSGRSLLALLERAIVYPQSGASPQVDPTSGLSYIVGNPPSASFTLASPGTILGTLIQQAQTRGTITQIDISTFSGATDSNGNTWSGSNTIASGANSGSQIVTLSSGLVPSKGTIVTFAGGTQENATVQSVSGQVITLTYPLANTHANGTVVSWGNQINQTIGAGTTVLQVLQDMVANGLVEAQMVGRSLHLYRVGTLGTTKPDTVVLRLGQQITDASTRSTSRDLTTVMLASGDNNTYIEIADTASANTWGRREKMTQHGGVGDYGTLKTLATYDVQQVNHVKQQMTTGLVLASSAAQPYTDFVCGDFIWRDTSGSQVSVRVRQITVSADASGNLTAGVNLNDLLMENDIILARRLSSITTLATGSGPLPTPTAPTDTVAPSPPTGVDFTTAAYISSASGAVSAQFTATWLAPTTNINGTALSDLSGYIVEWHYVGDETNSLNLLPVADRDFESGVGSWTGSGTTVAASSVQKLTGAQSLAVTTTGAGTVYALAASVAILPTQANYFSTFAYVLTPAGARTAIAHILYYDASSALISTVQVSGFATNASTWTKIAVNAPAPTLARFARIQVGMNGTATNEIWYIDRAGIIADQWNPVGFVSTPRASFSPVQPGRQIEVHVAAIDNTNNVSTFATSPVRVSGFDAVPPAAPSTPILTVPIEAIRVAWNGLDINGNNQPADFAFLEVHASTTSSFTPTPSTLIDTIRSPNGGTALLTGLSIGTLYYVRLVAVDLSGNRSAASAQASATSILVQTADIAANAITSALIVNGAITAAKTTLSAIDPASGSLSINSVNTNNLVAGSITGVKIVAGAIDTSKLSVAALAANGIPNGTFEDYTGNTPLQWSVDLPYTTGPTPANRVTTIETTSPISGLASLKQSIAGTADGTGTTSAPVGASEGEIWVFSAQFYVTGTLNAVDLFFRVLTNTPSGNLTAASPTLNNPTWTDPTGATGTPASGNIQPGQADIASGWTPPALNTPYTLSGQVVMPAGTKNFTVSLFAWVGKIAGGYTITWDNITARKLQGTAEIVNASIIDAKIASLSVSKLIAGTITADTAVASKIYAGSFTPQVVTIPAAVTTFSLTFNGQTTSALTRSTVTAAQVQSALNALSTISGNVTVAGATAGPFTVTFIGSLSSTTSLLTATTVTGSGTITITGPARVYIDSTGIKAYASTSVVTAPAFSVDSGSGIATIIGGSFQSSSNVGDGLNVAGSAGFKIDTTNGFQVYKSTSTTAVLRAAMDGSLTLAGNLTATAGTITGPSITGASIVGGTIATGANGAFPQVRMGGSLGGGGLGFYASSFAGGGFGGSAAATEASIDTSGNLSVQNYDQASGRQQGYLTVADYGARIGNNFYGTSLTVGSADINTGGITNIVLTSGGCFLRGSSGTIVDVGSLIIQGSSGYVIYLYTNGGTDNLVQYRGTNDGAWLSGHASAYLYTSVNGRSLGQTASQTGSQYVVNATSGTGSGGTVKTFVIDHPTDKTKHLVHAALEGPTADVFYRGRAQLINGYAKVALPDYFEALTEEWGRTVQLTPLAAKAHFLDLNYNEAHAANLVASEVTNGFFYVGQTAGFHIPDAMFYWEVKAVRKATQFEAEPLRAASILHGDGPYTYLTKKGAA